MKNYLRSYNVKIYVPKRNLSVEYQDAAGYVKPTKSTEMEEITFTDPLKIEFEVKKTALRNSNIGIITLWNLSPDMERRIIIEGSEVILEAGYKDNSSIIFVGSIIQPLRGKTNGTDYYLKLICIDGDSYLNLAFSSATLESGQSKQQLAQQTLRASNLKDVEVIIQDLNKLPNTVAIDGSSPLNDRPKVVFGKTSEIIDRLAKMGNATSYMDGGELKFFTLDDQPNLASAWEINVNTGMIGTPQQSLYQVEVKTLLNPKIRIGDYVHLNNADIMAQQYGITETPYLLESDGYYKVIEIQYSGDSRGQDWYSIIKAITKQGKIPSMLSTNTGNLVV